MPTKGILNDLDFVDGLHGWIVGSYGMLLHTADGGKSWETQQLPDTSLYHLLGVDFVDIHYGWIVGESTEDTLRAFIARTQDGGKTWVRQRQGLPERGNRAKCVAFLDTQNGWVGAAWTMFRTSDGGTNWFHQPSPPTLTWGAITGIQFVDAQIGWAVGLPLQPGHGGQTYLTRTTDGGNTWEGVEDRVGVIVFNTLFDLDFVDRECGWVVGDTGHIWHTGDGGDTWEIQGGWPGDRFLDDWFCSFADLGVLRCSGCVLDRCLCSDSEQLFHLGIAFPEVRVWSGL